MLLLLPDCSANLSRLTLDGQGVLALLCVSVTSLILHLLVRVTGVRLSTYHKSISISLLESREDPSHFLSLP